MAEEKKVLNAKEKFEEAEKKVAELKEKPIKDALEAAVKAISGVDLKGYRGQDAVIYLLACLIAKK